MAVRKAAPTAAKPAAGPATRPSRGPVDAPGKHHRKPLPPTGSTSGWASRRSTGQKSVKAGGPARRPRLRSVRPVDTRRAQQAFDGCQELLRAEELGEKRIGAACGERLHPPYFLRAAAQHEHRARGVSRPTLECARMSSSPVIIGIEQSVITESNGCCLNALQPSAPLVV